MSEAESGNDQVVASRVNRARISCWEASKRYMAWLAEPTVDEASRHSIV